MGLLILAFTLIPFVELYLLIRIGRVVGPGYTLVFVVAMAVLGAWLARQQGRRVMEEWRRAMAEGRVPEEGVLGGLLILAGGLLLITPGVLTDFVGLFFLLPWTRKQLARALRVYLEKQVTSGRAQVHAYGFEWPPRAPSSQGPTQVGRGPGRQGDVVDTEGEEIR